MIIRNRLRAETLIFSLASIVAVTTLGQAATLPIGFTETEVAKGLNPTTMTFAPDGRLFLCEKQGLIRVISRKELLPAPVLDITGAVDSWNERGLLSVCFDPLFERNGWIYVYYTYNRKPSDDSHASSNNRVSRFTTMGNMADPKSELVILELNDLTKTGWHNGGGLAFGKDGKLYVSTGENNNGANAQDSTNLLGKLLRINKDGTIPSDNPHYKEYKGQNRAIAALGLRNPFNISVNRISGQLYLSMVGANYEEIEEYESGKVPSVVNYGWPGVDGPIRNQTRPQGYQDPVYAYDHGRGDATALCGGDFYLPSAPGSGAFPAEHTGRFFFSDYKGWIKSIDPSKPETRFDFATGIDRPIDVDTAPDGELWYIARAGIPGGSDAANSASTNGSVWRIRWSGGGQPAKLAITVQPESTNVGTSLGKIQVALQDSSGKTVTAANDTVTLTLDSSPGSAALAGTTEVRAVKGVATFPNVMISKPGNGYTLRAFSGDLPPVITAPFDIDNQLSAPEITPTSGRFTGPVWMKISTPTAGATIRVTRDGSVPGATSPAYTGPFQISGDTTIRAVLQRTGLTDSTISSSEIRINGNTPYGMDYRQPVVGVKLPATAEEGLPATLSATGIFTDKNLTIKAGIIPYTVNSPAWADGATMQRWLILPEFSKITFSPTGEFKWPARTVFVQHFEIVTNVTAKTRRRLETRILVLDESGIFGYGANYRWRADNSDADLVDAGGHEEVLKITDAGGTTREQTWSYPGRAMCFMCHTPNAGFVLGPKTRQLNGDHTYPGGRTDNQLRTWNYLQMFSSPLDENAIRNYAHTVSIKQPGASLDDRVRSYIDTNCAQCHRPDGTGAVWDARFDTPLEKQGIINGDVRNTFGLETGKIVVPGNPALSIMHLRMNSTSPAEQMPPMTRNVVDSVAIEVLKEWINGKTIHMEGSEK